MTRKLTFATIIVCFAIVHAIAWQRLDSIRHHDDPPAVFTATGD